MVVSVSDPDQLRVQVRDAPEATPGYARAAAFRRDAAGNLTWAQATASSAEPGSELVLQPVDFGAQ